MLYNNTSNGQLLEELLFSKSFLLTFIDVLEQQPSFSLRDRHVISILVLQALKQSVGNNKIDNEFFFSLIG